MHDRPLANPTTTSRHAIQPAPPLDRGAKIGSLLLREGLARGRGETAYAAFLADERVRLEAELARGIQ